MTVRELSNVEDERIAQYFAASPEEQEEMRKVYVAQIAAELLTAKAAFESEE